MEYREYRTLSGTDLLFKRDPKTGEWLPAGGQNDHQIVPYEVQPPVPARQQPPVEQQSQSVLAGFAALGKALDGQFYVGSHVDRARGFGIRTSLLSLLGLFSGIFYAVVVKQAPILSMTLFASIMAGLIVAWLVAYVLDKVSAPETVTLLLALGLLGWLRQERQERWERYEDE